MSELRVATTEHDLNGMGECRNWGCTSRLTQFYQVVPKDCNGTREPTEAEVVKWLIGRTADLDFKSILNHQLREMTKGVSDE